MRHRTWWAWMVGAVLAVMPIGGSPAAQGTTSVTVQWTSPGDDGVVGTATYYDLRYSTSVITAGNFWAAAQWTSGMPAPLISGTTQWVIVSGLQFGTTYYFALKAGDEANNWSLISNVLALTTSPAPDTAVPGAVTDLRPRP